MCMGGTPNIDIPKPPPPAKPSEALKTVQRDQQMARDNTLRRMAARLSLQQTNSTTPLGLSTPATTDRKTLLGS